MQYSRAVWTHSWLAAYLITTGGTQTPYHEVAADVDEHEHAGQLAQPQALPAVAQGCLYGGVP